MNLGEIETDLYARLGFSTSDTSAVARLRAFINQAHREVMSMKHFRRYRRKLLTCASIADTPFMALPYAASTIFGVYDRDNDTWLREKTLGWVRQADPGVTSTGSNPWGYAIYDLASPVIRQPANASQLFFKSTSASDGAGKTAFLQGIRTGNYPRATSIAMNGVTAVGFTPTDILIVNKFYMSAAAAGDVTLHEDSGSGTELACIPIGRQSSRYSLLHLHPIPSAVVTYHVDAEVIILDMADAADEPLFPEDFHYIITAKVRYWEYEKREKPALMKEARGEWRNGISELIAHVNKHQGMTDQREDAQRSQLGPWFPAGT